MSTPPLDTIVASVAENSRMKGKHMAVPPQFQKKAPSAQGQFPNKPPATARGDSKGPMNNVNQGDDSMTRVMMMRKQMQGKSK